MIGQVPYEVSMSPLLRPMTKIKYLCCKRTVGCWGGYGDWRLWSGSFVELEHRMTKRIVRTPVSLAEIVT